MAPSTGRGSCVAPSTAEQMWDLFPELAGARSGRMGGGHAARLHPQQFFNTYSTVPGTGTSIVNTTSGALRHSPPARPRRACASTATWYSNAPQTHERTVRGGVQTHPKLWTVTNDNVFGVLRGARALLAAPTPVAARGPSPRPRTNLCSPTDCVALLPGNARPRLPNELLREQPRVHYAPSVGHAAPTRCLQSELTRRGSTAAAET